MLCSTLVVAAAVVFAQADAPDEPWKAALAPGYAQHQDDAKKQADYEADVQRATDACLNDYSLARVRGQCAEFVRAYPGRDPGPTCAQNAADVAACPTRARAMVDASRRAKEVEQARLEEQGRREAAARQTESDEAAARAELAKDPRIAVKDISGIICHNLEVRAGQKKEIDEELKYAREGGGVIDKEKVHDNQDGMRLGDQTNAAWKQALQRRYHAKPLPCDKRLADKLDWRVLPQFTPDIYVQPDDAPWFVEP